MKNWLLFMLWKPSVVAAALIGLSAIVVSMIVRDCGRYEQYYKEYSNEIVRGAFDRRTGTLHTMSVLHSNCVDRCAVDGTFVRRNLKRSTEK